METSKNLESGTAPWWDNCATGKAVPTVTLKELYICQSTFIESLQKMPQNLENKTLNSLI